MSDPDRLRRRAFALARECGFSRDDRLSFATWVLKQDVYTWKFDSDDWADLVQALIGASAALELARQNGRLKEVA